MRRVRHYAGRRYEVALIEDKDFFVQEILHGKYDRRLKIQDRAAEVLRTFGRHGFIRVAHDMIAIAHKYNRLEAAI